MIVRDAEETLGPCLESVAPLVDEMIVVDTGSTDASASIAASFGACVIHTKWTKDFSAARNVYVRAASGSHILSLDADETLPPVHESFLRELIRSHERDSFVFQLRNYYHDADFVDPSILGESALLTAGSGISCRLSYTVRLFPRRRSVRYSFPVHESLLPSLLRKRIRLRSFPVPVEHVGFLLGNRSLLEKLSTYEALGRVKIRRFPRHAQGYLELAKILIWREDLAEAEYLLRQCLKVAPGNATTYAWLAKCLPGQAPPLLRRREAHQHP